MSKGTHCIIKTDRMSKRKERSIISIVGRTNVGKSSMLNLLSGQKDYAITDKTPGTTADTVTVLMEIHPMGPFKVLDTAGVDEMSELGDKKRRKTYEAIEEADDVEEPGCDFLSHDDGHMVVLGISPTFQVPVFDRPDDVRFVCGT